VSTDLSTSQRPHVLILSDDADLGSFLSEGLVLGGFWTSVIASGIQAMEVFRLRGFDLVLIDAMLSGMGAIEVIRRLRSAGGEDQPRTDVPILVITGGEGEMDPAEAAAAGADGLLLPPIELEDLIPELFGMVRSWRAAHPGRPWADEAAQARPDDPANGAGQ
jgi:DNA-binding response OmpR family regulator